MLKEILVSVLALTLGCAVTQADDAKKDAPAAENKDAAPAAAEVKKEADHAKPAEEAKKDEHKDAAKPAAEAHKEGAAASHAKEHKGGKHKKNSKHAADNKASEALRHGGAVSQVEVK